MAQEAFSTWCILHEVSRTMTFCVPGDFTLTSHKQPALVRLLILESFIHSLCPHVHTLAHADPSQQETKLTPNLQS